jgi:plasmid stabilization system protein ParE
MKVSITAMAAGDLEDIRRFIARNNASRAMTFVEELLSRCQNLAEDPRVGRRRPELESEGRLEMRSLAYKRYVILYAVES